MSENITNCPNCGGVIHDCICDYCGTIFTTTLNTLQGRNCLMIAFDDDDQIILHGFKARRIEIDMSTETYYTDNTMYHTFSDPDYVITASLQDTQSMTHMLRKFINIANTRLKISKKGCIYELYT